LTQPIYADMGFEWRQTSPAHGAAERVETR